MIQNAGFGGSLLYVNCVANAYSTVLVTDAGSARSTSQRFDACNVSRSDGHINDNKPNKNDDDDDAKAIIILVLRNDGQVPFFSMKLESIESRSTSQVFFHLVGNSCGLVPDVPTREL